MMITSTSRRRCKKVARSDVELTPADRPLSEVEPSWPTTKVATTLIFQIILYRAAECLNNLSVPTLTFVHMIIDCNKCTMAQIACNTCVDAFFLTSAPEISDETVTALTVLADSGLTPPLQFDARGA
jgi:hypothetical protein